MNVLRKISAACFIALVSFLCVSGTVYAADTASQPEPTITAGPGSDVSQNLSELRFDLKSFAPVVVGQDPLSLTIDAFQGLSCEWASRTPHIATVDKDGKVTAVEAGTAEIAVVVTDEDGRQYTYEIPVRVVAPYFEEKSWNLAVGCQGAIEVKDCSGEPLTVSVSDSDIVAYISDEEGVIKIKAGKEKGTATLSVIADGVSLSCKINVTNPYIKQRYGFYEKNKSFQPVLAGLNKKSKPEWMSLDTKIASVNSKGKGRTKKLGSTMILCRVDGKTLTYYLAVGTKTAVKAMRWGYSKMGKCHYSQARRMNRRYFDCSSFVYHCYRAAGRYLVRRTSWAPVAADIGHYYVMKKKKVRPSGKTYKLSSLRPGDLVCFGGKDASRNGRYKRIYHIALYIGNGQTIESSSSYNNVVIRDRGIMGKRGVPVIVRP